MRTHTERNGEDLHSSCAGRDDRSRCLYPLVNPLLLFLKCVEGVEWRGQSKKERHTTPTQEKLMMTQGPQGVMHLPSSCMKSYIHSLLTLHPLLS